MVTSESDRTFAAQRVRAGAGVFVCEGVGLNVMSPHCFEHPLVRKRHLEAVLISGVD
jgi:hypothetical protein